MDQHRIEDRIALAEEQLALCDANVEAQRRLVERARIGGMPVGSAETLLTLIETARTLRIAELERLRTMAGTASTERQNT